MVELSSRNLRQALTVGHTVMECDKLEELQSETLRLMQDLVGANSSVFVRFSGGAPQRKFREGVSHDVMGSSLKTWCDYYQKMDPVVNHYINRPDGYRDDVILTSDVVGYDEYIASEFYNDFLKPLSIHHVMLVALRQANNTIGVLGFHRPRNSPVFSIYDVTKSRFIAPYLSAAFSKTIALEKAAERERIIETLSTDLPYQGIIVLDQTLEPVYQNARAKELIGTLACNRGPAAAADIFFKELYRLCHRLKVDLDSGYDSSHSLRSAITPGHGRNPVNIHLRPLLSDETNLRFLICLEVEPQTKLRSKCMKMSEFTKREIDIVQLVSYGLTNIQVARKLFISVRTVENHLRSIYQKADVHNRTALIHRVTDLN